MQIFLYSDNERLKEHWNQSLKHDAIVVNSLESLKKIANNLIILNDVVDDESFEKLLLELNAQNNLVLVLHTNPTLEKAKKFLSFGSRGYGNAFMREHFLVSAVESIKEGFIWLHPEYISLLINQIPQKEPQVDDSLVETLTHREREVALLLKDGLRYKEISQALDITVRTVKAHASSCYSKLGVEDRIGLALLLK